MHACFYFAAVLLPFRWSKVGSLFLVGCKPSNRWATESCRDHESKTHSTRLPTTHPPLTNHRSCNPLCNRLKCSSCKHSFLTATSHFERAPFFKTPPPPSCSISAANKITPPPRTHIRARKNRKARHAPCFSLGRSRGREGLGAGAGGEVAHGRAFSGQRSHAGTPYIKSLFAAGRSVSCGLGITRCLSPNPPPAFWYLLAAR